MRDIGDVVTQLRAQGADKVGVTGFCMGGLMTYLTATSGIEGLALWRARGHALVITDIHMPDMDGFELTRQMRAEEGSLGRSRTPIVALTANALEDEAERCLQADMDDYLTKPLTLERLREAVARWAIDEGANAIDRSVVEGMFGANPKAVARVLKLYATALSGHEVAIRGTNELQAVDAYGADHIILPPEMRFFEDDEGNFTAYKVAAAHGAGRIEFGTYEFVDRQFEDTLHQGRGKLLPEVSNLNRFWRLMASFSVRRRKDDIYVLPPKERQIVLLTLDEAEHPLTQGMRRR